jgi:hypothetical protein
MLNRGIVKMRDGKECSTGKAWGCSIAEDQNCADYENCGDGKCVKKGVDKCVTAGD